MAGMGMDFETLVDKEETFRKKIKTKRIRKNRITEEDAFIMPSQNSSRELSRILNSEMSGTIVEMSIAHDDSPVRPSLRLSAFRPADFSAFRKW